MVGSLQYITDYTQLDIVFITSQLVKHLKSLSMLHYNALVYYIQYLNRMPEISVACLPLVLFIIPARFNHGGTTSDVCDR